MPDCTLVLVRDALAAQLDTVLTPVIQDLQVSADYLTKPTTPSLDFLPDGEPFGEVTSFGDGSVFTYRIRGFVHTADLIGAQRLLLSMMDPYADTSVRKAVNANPTLGGLVEEVNCSHPSDFIVATDVSRNGALMACTWLVRAELQ